MEARQKGGPQEAHLVEWPLEQRPAVNVLRCHAPNGRRAGCARPPQRTLPPGVGFVKGSGRGRLALRGLAGLRANPGVAPRASRD